MIKAGLIIAACLVVAVLVIGFISDPFHWRKTAELKGEVVVAEQGQELATRTTGIAARAYATERQAGDTVAPAIITITEAPNAQTPLPDDVRAPWLAAVVSLRDQASSVDDQRPQPTE